LSNFCRRIW